MCRDCAQHPFKLFLLMLKSIQGVTKMSQPPTSWEVQEWGPILCWWHASLSTRVHCPYHGSRKFPCSSCFTVQIITLAWKHPWIINRLRTLDFFPALRWNAQWWWFLQNLVISSRRGNSSDAPLQAPLPTRYWFQIPKPKATLCKFSEVAHATQLGGLGNPLLPMTAQ